MVFICFRYDLSLGFVSGLVLQLWFWYGFSYDVDMGQHCDFDGQKCEILENISESYQTESHQNRLRLNIASKPYQNRIKIISKQFKIQTIKKKTQNWPKTCPWAVSISFVEANPLGTLKKVLRSQTMSKPYQHHIQRSTTISKPEPKPYQKTYQYHVEITTPDSKRMKCISEYHINTILNSSKQ